MSATAEKRADWLALDHAEALIDNAQRDADDLARCNATAAAMLTQGRSLEPAYMIADGLDMADVEPAIDYEAIAWAYQKLLAFGVGNGSMDNALMLDRLNLMLLGAA